MAFDDDDVLVKQESNPVTTTLLIVSAVALALSIWLASQHLGLYVNPETRSMTSDFTVSPVDIADRELRAIQDEAVGFEREVETDEFGL